MDIAALPTHTLLEGGQVHWSGAKAGVVTQSRWSESRVGARWQVHGHLLIVDIPQVIPLTQLSLVVPAQQPRKR